MEQKTVAAFQRFIQLRGDLLEAAHRNGYVLPKLTTSICSEEYLVNVINQELYCPKDSEVRLKNCFAPPEKETLMKKLLKVEKEQQKNLGIDDKHIPDKKWMVMMLGMINPKDEIFAKDYVPPPIRAKKEDRKVINMPSGFLKGLPQKP